MWLLNESGKPRSLSFKPLYPRLNEFVIFKTEKKTYRQGSLSWRFDWYNLRQMTFCNQANQAQGVLDPATLDALSKYGSTFSFFPNISRNIYTKMWGHRRILIRSSHLEKDWIRQQEIKNIKHIFPMTYSTMSYQNWGYAWIILEKIPKAKG
jgi:hypothetical protein